jgi:hypothetical protein
MNTETVRDESTIDKAQKLGDALMDLAYKEPDIRVVLTAVTLVLATIVNIADIDHEHALDTFKMALEQTNDEGNKLILSEH